MFPLASEPGCESSRDGSTVVNRRFHSLILDRCPSSTSASLPSPNSTVYVRGEAVMLIPTTSPKRFVCSPPVNRIAVIELGIVAHGEIITVEIRR